MTTQQSTTGQQQLRTGEEERGRYGIQQQQQFQQQQPFQQQQQQQQQQGLGQGRTMKAVVFKGKGRIAVEDVQFPTFEPTIDGQRRACPHGAIVKVITSCICGSDGHMLRGRGMPDQGLILGHEVTGQVIEVGPHVEFVRRGDIVSVPANVACGLCENCKEGKTSICLNVNSKTPGGIYGYVNMGGWPGGQAEYMLVPYADFNLLKLPVDTQTLFKRIGDISLLADALPTAFYAVDMAGVGVGSNVYIAGAGTIGLCCAALCLQLFGAANVIIGDYHDERLDLARRLGCDVINVSQCRGRLTERIREFIGTPFVDCAIDAAGFETCGHGAQRLNTQDRSEVLNDIFEVIKFGGKVGIVGVYLTQDQGAEDELGKQGGVALTKWALGWTKGVTIGTGQVPAMRYNRKLLKAVLSGQLQVARYLNMRVIRLEDAEAAYREFNAGVPRKFVFDPHGLIAGGMSGLQQQSIGTQQYQF